ADRQNICGPSAPAAAPLAAARSWRRPRPARGRPSPTKNHRLRLEEIAELLQARELMAEIRRAAIVEQIAPSPWRDGNHYFLPDASMSRRVGKPEVARCLLDVAMEQVQRDALPEAPAAEPGPGQSRGRNVVTHQDRGVVKQSEPGAPDQPIDPALSGQ